MPAKNPFQFVLMKSMPDSIGAHGDLVRRDPGLEAPRPARGCLRVGLRDQRRRTAVEARDAVEPARERRGIALQPFRAGGLGCELAVEDAAHDAALAIQRELEVLEQPAEVRAFLEEALAHVGVDHGTAVVRAEARVAAGEIPHVEARVHRVRFPAEEYDGPLCGDRALHLREHALLARLDQLEGAKAVPVLGDHFQHEAVAVVARLDAVDLVAQLRREALDVVEVTQSGLVQVGGHGKRVLRAFEVRPQDFHGAVGLVGRAVRCLCRHPVAEEHVDVAVLEGCVSDGHRKHGDVRLVAEHPHQVAREAGRRRDVGPADVREADHPAGFRIGGGP